MSTNLLTKYEVAKILRRNPETVIRYAREGRLRSTRPGGREYRFPEEYVEEFLAESETPPPVAVDPEIVKRLERSAARRAANAAKTNSK